MTTMYPSTLNADNWDLSEYEPDEGLAYLNEVVADDADDPLLESYQHLGMAQKSSRPADRN